MPRWSKTFFIPILAASMLIAVASVGAQEKGKKEVPYAKPYPMGQVTIHLTSVGAGVGVEWGKGVLTYEGKQYSFKVKGLDIGTLGISTATAKGNVYNLFGISEFPGTYEAVGAGAALFKGEEGEAFRNSKGVHIILKAQEKGVNLKIGPEGFKITLQEVLSKGEAPKK
jgi:hypothetical protein